QHEAAQTCRRAIAIREKLRDDFPHDAEHQRRLGQEYVGLAEALVALGRTQEAEDALVRSLAVAKKLVADHAGVTPYPYLLAHRYQSLGLLLHDTNRPQEAADAFRQARKLFEDCVGQFPDDAKYQHSFAWFLGTCPAPQFRDGARAVEAAKRAL